MIRFAPQAAHIAAPIKAIKESSAVEPAKVTDERKEITETGMLLAELPQVSAPVRPKTTSSDQSSKTRSPRKSKAKPDATPAMQLDLNA